MFSPRKQGSFKDPRFHGGSNFGVKRVVIVVRVVVKQLTQTLSSIQKEKLLLEKLLAVVQHESSYNPA